MIDLAQADSTLRNQTKQDDCKFYYVMMLDGTMQGSFDSYNKALKFVMSNWDDVDCIVR
jgi:hypothetical protein